MKTLLRILQLPAVLCGVHLLTVTAVAQTTAFTYQGRLTDNAAAANGNYDIRFTLHSAATGNTAVGSAVVVNPVTVLDGLFTTALDFGASFPGADRWLQIEVRPAGSATGYTLLTPRQKLTSAPYATRAASAGTSAALSGNLSASQISGGTLAVSVIGDGTLPAAKLTAESISATQLAPGSVGNGEIAATAVTSDKLAATIGVWNKSGATINYTAGNIGIGTTTPQGKLEINTGAPGSVTFRNEANLVPGLNVSGTGAYAGFMRFRNVLEVWPNDANTASGRVAVLGTSGSTSINLDGANGDISGNSLTANTGVGVVSIRNDSNLAPGINVSGGSNPGILRLRNKLEVWPNDAGTSSGYVQIRNAAGASTIALDGQSGDASIKTLTANTGVGVVTIRNDSGLVPAINVSGGGFPGIMRFRNALEVWPNDSGTSAGRVDVRNTSGNATIVLDGQTGDSTVKTMTITGGADIAEPFDLADPSLEPGTVMVIDATSPGRLLQSTGAYDKRVAGIISGAGGISTGLSLHQEGVNSGGRKVALTGRVYVKADAGAAPIEPGDLLTTSSMAGHAMKAGDSAKRQGAVLGKAMSRLDRGTGLVLVLVTLQ